MLVDLKELKERADDDVSTVAMELAFNSEVLIAIAERLDRLCDLVEKAQEKWI